MNDSFIEFDLSFTPDTQKLQTSQEWHEKNHLIGGDQDWTPDSSDYCDNIPSTLTGDEE